jgi:choline dehydrogenase-like flavoprotein
MNACEAANIPIVEDYNTGNSTGVKQGTATLDKHLLRSSSYDGYLKQALSRKNLDVLYYAPVQQLLSNTDGDRPKVTGVRFMDYPTGRTHQVHASKEVVVSMGAFQSPQLLMVSVSGLFQVPMMPLTPECRGSVLRLSLKSLPLSPFLSTRTLVESKIRPNISSSTY